VRFKKTAVMIAIVVTGVAVTVSAQASFSQCDANRVCMWGNNDFDWLIGERAPNGGLVSVTGDANDQMDSWGNRTVVNAAGHEHTNGSGDCQTFQFGSNDNNVNFFNSDEVSSWRTNHGC
jgi:Peptidase inhibitor family I36